MGKQAARSQFGKRIRKLRLKRNWTQKELARRTGISERYLQRIESNQPPDVTIDTIDKFAKALKLSAWNLLAY